MSHLHLKNIATLFCNIKNINFSYKKCEETPLCGFPRRRKGSITIEAAGVCSLAAIMIGSMLMMFVVLQQEYLLRQTMYQVQETATIAGIADKNKILPVLIAHSHIAGDENSLINPVFYATEEDGVIYYEGYVTIPLLAWNRENGITISNKMTVYGFNGYCLDDGQEQEYVYITTYGTVYHKDLSCSHLNLKIKAVAYSEIENYRNNSGGIYYPCDVCGDVIKEGICYITPYGNRYHSTRECSSLLRNIQKILITEVGERKPCSSCYSSS